MTNLTETERQTLNAAMAILVAKCPYKTSWSLYWAHYNGCSPSMGLTLFAPEGDQHGNVRGDTFADKIEVALALCAAENPDEIRAKRIAKLRAELGNLEQGGMNPLTAWRSLKRQCADHPKAPQPDMAGLIGATLLILLVSIIGIAACIQWGIV